MSTYVDGCLQYKKMGDQIKNSKFSKKKKKRESEEEEENFEKYI